MSVVKLSCYTIYVVVSKGLKDAKAGEHHWSIYLALTPSVGLMHHGGDFVNGQGAWKLTCGPWNAPASGEALCFMPLGKLNDMEDPEIIERHLNRAPFNSKLIGTRFSCRTWFAIAAKWLHASKLVKCDNIDQLLVELQTYADDVANERCPPCVLPRALLQRCK